MFRLGDSFSPKDSEVFLRMFWAAPGSGILVGIESWRPELEVLVSSSGRLELKAIGPPAIGARPLTPFLVGRFGSGPY